METATPGIIRLLHNTASPDSKTEEWEAQIISDIWTSSNSSWLYLPRSRTPKNLDLRNFQVARDRVSFQLRSHSSATEGNYYRGLQFYEKGHIFFAARSAYILAEKNLAEFAGSVLLCTPNGAELPAELRLGGKPALAKLILADPTKLILNGVYEIFAPDYQKQVACVCLGTSSLVRMAEIRNILENLRGPLNIYKRALILLGLYGFTVLHPSLQGRLLKNKQYHAHAYLLVTRKLEEQLKRKIIAASKSFGGVAYKSIIQEEAPDKILRELLVAELLEQGLIKDIANRLVFNEEQGEAKLRISPFGRNILSQIEEAGIAGRHKLSFKFKGSTAVLNKLELLGLVKNIADYYYTINKLSELETNFIQYLDSEYGYNISSLAENSSFSISKWKKTLVYLEQENLVYQKDSLWFLNI